MSEKEGERYYTVKDAAEILGVSDRTVRNRIKKGRLEAEMVKGAYGYEYRLPADQFDNAAQQVQEVVPVKTPIPVDEFGEQVAERLREAVRADIREELADRTQKISQQMEALLAENRRLRRAVEQNKKIIEDIKDKEQRQGLWFKLLRLLRGR